MGGTSASRERVLVAAAVAAIASSAAGAAAGSILAGVLEREPFAWVGAGALLGTIGGALAGARRLAPRLPDQLDGWFARRRVLAIVWLATAALAVANTARVAIFAGDPAQAWASALPFVPESASHHCVAAYVRAGELAAAGQSDLWNRDDYTTDAAPRTALPGLAPHLGDPFEYPPPFALLSRAAVAATHDYGAIRAVWFALSTAGFWLAFAALALWIGGRAGATALLLAPVLAISVPLVLGLQFGQAHLLVAATAIAGVMQLARGRTAGGAALLAFAIVTKIFPGLLLVHLAVRRRWRDAGATLGMVALMLAVAAVVLGPSTIAAYITGHIPRLASGEAFAFAETNFDNHAPYGLAFKLDAIGLVDGGRGLAGALAWVWTAVAVALAIVVSRVPPAAYAPAARACDAVIWLALLCLATLRSPFAPTYTALGTLWLLALAAGTAPRRRWPLTAAIAVTWLAIQGTPPVPGDPAAEAIASLPGQLLSMAIPIIACIFTARCTRRSLASP